MNERYARLADECFGRNRDESVRKIAEKIWEAGDRLKGIDYENWKAAEWVYDHLVTLISETSRSSARYIDAERTLMDLRGSWKFAIASFVFPSFARMIDRNLERAMLDDVESDT